MSSKKSPKTLFSNNNDLNYRIITAESPSSIPAENYRRAKVSLSFSEVDKELKVISVISATQGEGKTTALENIGMTYVEDGLKVIFVDLDLRRPKLHRYAHVKNENGVTDVLTNKIQLKDAIKHTTYGYDLLNSGSKCSFPTSMLGSNAIDEMIASLKKEYDIVLIDCPPILSVSDGVVIARFVDGFIYIVSQQKTKRRVARDAMNVLRQNKVPVIGTMLTEISKGSTSSYYYYYKYYYTSYGDKEKHTSHH